MEFADFHSYNQSDLKSGFNTIPEHFLKGLFEDYFDIDRKPWSRYVSLAMMKHMKIVT